MKTMKPIKIVALSLFTLGFAITAHSADPAPGAQSSLAEAVRQARLTPSHSAEDRVEILKGLISQASPEDEFLARANLEIASALLSARNFEEAADYAARSIASPSDSTHIQIFAANIRIQALAELRRDAEVVRASTSLKSLPMTPENQAFRDLASRLSCEARFRIALTKPTKANIESALTEVDSVLLASKDVDGEGTVANRESLAMSKMQFLEKLGDRDQAAESVEKFLAMFPNTIQAQNFALKALVCKIGCAELDLKPEAIKELVEKYPMHRPDQAQLRYQLALSYSRWDRNDEALSTAQQLVTDLDRMTDGKKSIHFLSSLKLVAISAYEVKDFETASRAANRIVEEFPTSQHASEVREWVSQPGFEIQLYQGDASQKANESSSAGAILFAFIGGIGLTSLAYQKKRIRKEN